KEGMNRIMRECLSSDMRPPLTVCVVALNGVVHVYRFGQRSEPEVIGGDINTRLQPPLNIMIVDRTGAAATGVIRQGGDCKPFHGNRYPSTCSAARAGAPSDRLCPCCGSSAHSCSWCWPTRC